MRRTTWVAIVALVACSSSTDPDDNIRLTGTYVATSNVALGGGTSPLVSSAMVFQANGRSFIRTDVVTLADGRRDTVTNNFGCRGIRVEFWCGSDGAQSERGAVLREGFVLRRTVEVRTSPTAIRYVLTDVQYGRPQR